jgi:hypothetical protein
MLKPFPLIVKVKELPCADCWGAKLVIVIWALHGSANSVRNKQEQRIRFAIGVSLTHFHGLDRSKSGIQL